MKVRLRTNKKIVVEFHENASGPAIGKIEVFIFWKGPKATFEIYTPEINEGSRQGLADYAAALKKACSLLGAKIDSPAKLSGAHVDPDEPTVVKGFDCTVIFKIYKRDNNHFLTFTRHDETGKVGSHLKSFTHRDIPSAVQLACVAEQAAALMVKYESIE